MDGFSQLGFQTVVWNGIEEMPYIHFEDILAIPRVSPDPLLYDLLPLMGTSARKTGIAVFVHSFAEHGFHCIHNAALNKQLLHCRHDDSTLLAGNSVVYVNRHMLGVFVVDDPV